LYRRLSLLLLRQLFLRQLFLRLLALRLLFLRLLALRRLPAGGDRHQHDSAGQQERALSGRHHFLK